MLGLMALNPGTTGSILVLAVGAAVGVAAGLLGRVPTSTATPA